MQSIGQTLKQAREDQRITLDKASEVTRIRAAYLQALEADDHASLPSPVQARGFLRNYAEYLGLSFDQLIDSMRASQTNADAINGPGELTTESEISGSDSSSSLQSTPLSTPEPEAVSQTVLPADQGPAALLPNESTDDEPGEEAEAGAETLADDSIEAVVRENPTESDQIFIEIGAELRKRRELLSLHLDEVERNTHVKAHYLAALEKGVMQDVLSTVQTRGMLSNYASFLDLDVDAVLLRYADALQARHREKYPQRPARKPGQSIISSLPPLRSFIAGDMIFGVGVAVTLIVFSIWGINWVLTLQSQKEIQPTAPSISDVLLATPETALSAPTLTPLPADLFVEATQTIMIPTQNLNVNVQLNLVAVERAFMRVLVDGEEVFNGRVVPGTAYLYEAENQIEILVGNGAAIRVSYNGRDLGLLGGLGQVVAMIYREDEIMTPTAPPTATPTSTIPPTATLPSTPTLPPTLTPAPSSTMHP